MGNDGGSIPDRRDLVKTKAKAEQADKANQTRARWLYCALSKKPLEEPVVSCALGKLYNKDALIEYMLDKTAYGDGAEICGHIKSLKEVKTLKLTPNPARSRKGTDSPPDTDQDGFYTPFVCPLTLKEMNGSFPFVYIATCGCVVSQAGLKALAATSTTPPASEDKDKGEEKDDEPRQLDLCPQCGEKYDRLLDVRMINPDTETEALMRSAMEARKRKEKEKGKSGKGDKKSSARKRKAGDADAEPEPVLEAKKAKASTANKVQPAPSLNPTIAAASRAIAASLAQEEAKRKAGMSDAVKSLYEGKANATKETFMTRGTFTRYA